MIPPPRPSRSASNSKRPRPEPSAAFGVRAAWWPGSRPPGEVPRARRRPSDRPAACHRQAGAGNARSPHDGHGDLLGPRPSCGAGSGECAWTWRAEKTRRAACGCIAGAGRGRDGPRCGGARRSRDRHHSTAGRTSERITADRGGGASDLVDGTATLAASTLEVRERRLTATRLGGAIAVHEARVRSAEGRSPESTRPSARAALTRPSGVPLSTEAQ